MSLSGTAAGTVSVRRAGTADLEALAALETACFPPDERWSAPSWRAELEGDDRAVWVAVCADRPDRGVCAVYEDLVAASCFHIGGGDAELFRVMTAPDRRGLGLATMLVVAGFAWARDRGAGRVLLEVRHDNATARSLYADLGFTDLYLRTNYYAYGQDAVVMCRPLDGPGPVAPAPLAPSVSEHARGALWADLHGSASPEPPAMPDGDAPTEGWVP